MKSFHRTANVTSFVGKKVMEVDLTVKLLQAKKMSIEVPRHKVGIIAKCSLNYMSQQFYMVKTYVCWVDTFGNCQIWQDIPLAGVP